MKRRACVGDKFEVRFWYLSNICNIHEIPNILSSRNIYPRQFLDAHVGLVPILLWMREMGILKRLKYSRPILQIGGHVVPAKFLAACRELAPGQAMLPKFPPKVVSVNRGP